MSSKLPPLPKPPLPKPLRKPANVVEPSKSVKPAPRKPIAPTRLPSKLVSPALQKRMTTPGEGKTTGNSPLPAEQAKVIAKEEQPKINAVLARYKKAKELKGLTSSAHKPIQQGQAIKRSSSREELMNKFRKSKEAVDLDESIHKTKVVDNARRELQKPVTPSRPKHIPHTPKHTTIEVSSTFNKAIGKEEATPKVVRVEKHELTYDITNPEQRRAIDWSVEGKSFVLIGSAGTGKTATQRLSVQAMLDSFTFPLLSAENTKDHKYLVAESPAVVVLTYMNKAANNIRKALPEEMASNVLTIHKFLQYAPVKETREVIDEETGDTYETEVQVFKPTFTADNKIYGIKCVIIEEASTVDAKLLFKALTDALADVEDIQFIFLGDLKQLPPPFGEGVLSIKLLELPVVELVTTYRQHLESPIKRFAVAINEGKAIQDDALKQFFEVKGELDFFLLSGRRPAGTKGPDGRNFIARTKNAFEDNKKAVQLANLFCTKLSEGEFVPFRDIILCPHKQNKRDDINCDYINRLLADSQGQKRHAVVHEIVAGRMRHYLAVDDPVTYNKEDYLIINIEENPKYKGMPTKTPHTSLDRWGQYTDSDLSDMDQGLDLNHDEEYLQKLLDTNVQKLSEGKSGEEEDDEIKKAASHIITLMPAEAFEGKPLESDLLDADKLKKLNEVKLTSSGDINKLDFAYMTTVHKSIGSEWEKVWYIHTHYMATMAFRELLYTAVSRAKSYLGIFYDGHDCVTNQRNSSMIAKAIINPRIKGVTLDEKLQWLKLQAEKAKMADPTEVANLLNKFKK